MKRMDRNIFYIGLTSFLTDTMTKMVYSVMPMFLISIGASKTELSLIEGIAESTASVIKALSGWWSDVIRKNKPFMVIGYAFTAILSPLYFFTTSPLHVLAIRFIERVGKGIRTAPRDSLIAASAQVDRKGLGFGFHKAMDNSGAIIGPLLATLILAMSRNNYRIVFLLSAIPGIAGLISVSKFVKERNTGTHKTHQEANKERFSWDFYFLLVVVTIFTLGNSTDALLLVKSSDIGFEPAAIPILYMVFNSVSVVLAMPMGFLSDKFGRGRVIVSGYILYSIVYMGFALAGNKWQIVALFILYGVYSASTDGVQKALVSDMVEKTKVGTGLGIYSSVVGMTLLPASLIAGYLYDKYDNSTPFMFGSFMAMIAAILMWILMSVRKRRKAGV